MRGRDACAPVEEEFLEKGRANAEILVRHLVHELHAILWTKEATKEILGTEIEEAPGGSVALWADLVMTVSRAGLCSSRR